MYKKCSILANKLMLQLTLTLGVKAGNMKKNFNTGSILGVGLGNEQWTLMMKIYDLYFYSAESSHYQAIINY